ncbi:MAG: hypothetical protein ACRDAX_03240 [Propionibacteriaceae bacterium]
MTYLKKFLVQLSNARGLPSTMTVHPRSIAAGTKSSVRNLGNTVGFEPEAVNVWVFESQMIAVPRFHVRVLLPSPKLACTSLAAICIRWASLVF